MNTTLNKLLITSCLALSATQVSAVEGKFYGLGHLSTDSVDDGEDSSVYIASNSSRLGFSMNHQIRDNLKLVSQYESGVDLTGQGENDGNGPANGNSIFTKTRPSFIGLEGDFGKVLLGHMPALDQWANDHNYFADQVGDLGNFWEASGVPGRIDNTIHYASPNLYGFDLAITYAPEEETEDSESLFFKSNYNSGDLKLGLGYASLAQGGGLDNHTVVAITAGYELDQFSVGLGYQIETDISGISGNDRNSFMLGGSLNLNKNSKFKAQYAMTDGDSDQSSATMLALGYDYMLDEYTTIYAAYALVDNDEGTQFSVNGKGHGDKVVPATGGDPSALSIGIVAKFDINIKR